MDVKELDGRLGSQLGGIKGPMTRNFFHLNVSS